MKQKYSSNRKFNITDFHISHGQMLIRSAKMNENEFNIDIIFYDVKFLQIPDFMKGISIKKAEINNNLLHYDSIRRKLNFKENFLFEVISEDEVFLIGASFFKVFENSLDFNESSLGIVNLKGREKILFNSLDDQYSHPSTKTKFYENMEKLIFFILLVLFSFQTLLS